MKVLITPRGFANYGLDEVKLMESKGLEVDYNDTGKAYSAEQFLQKAKDADAIIVGVDDMSEPVMKQLPKLKVVCKFGVGVDNIDCDYAKEHGIYVGRTVGSNSLSVAEHVAALMFADAKNLYPTIRDVKAGSWVKRTGIELSGKTLGIIGFGAIGKRLSRIASGIGMSVLAYDTFPIKEEDARDYGAKIAGFEEIIEDSDYVSVHVPLLDSTRNMISTEQFKSMKSSACVLNAARGGVVDEDALYHALTDGEIRSAVFDVFTTEPPAKDNPLLGLDNFLLTSHTASRTHEAEKRTCQISTDVILTQLGLKD